MLKEQKGKTCPTKVERKPLILKAVTMIYPAIGWFKIAECDDKRAITVADIAEWTWLNRCPWPDLVNLDRGKEFAGIDFKDMIKSSCGVKTKFATTRNPQANAITERSHQVLANLCRTFELEDNCMDETDPWAGILSAAAFAMRSTFHTTLNATPGQLVFGRDMILNITYQADWQAIRQRKQSVIKKNNEKENSKRIPHVCGVGDKFLLEKDANKHKLDDEGPCDAIAANDNGALKHKKGTVIDDANVGCCIPHCEKESTAQWVAT